MVVLPWVGAARASYSTMMQLACRASDELDVDVYHSQRADGT